MQLAAAVAKSVDNGPKIKQRSQPAELRLHYRAREQCTSVPLHLEDPPKIFLDPVCQLNQSTVQLPASPGYLLLLVLVLVLVLLFEPINEARRLANKKKSYYSYLTLLTSQLLIHHLISPPPTTQSAIPSFHSAWLATGGFSLRSRLLVSGRLIDFLDLCAPEPRHDLSSPRSQSQSSQYSFRPDTIDAARSPPPSRQYEHFYAGSHLR